MRNEFYYKSQDGVTEIHAVEWVPQQKPIAILQIAHGMVEYVLRYNEFAEYLNAKGIYVIGNDHLGHGQSMLSERELGFFCLDDGNAKVLGDMRALHAMTAQKFAECPYFLMGHSMGSFLTRQYVARYGDTLDGAIIMGTGVQPSLMLTGAKAIIKTMAAFKGWRHRSKFIDDLAFGAFNKSFEPARTSKDWLSNDEAQVDAYINDPLCGNLFTLNGYYNMMLSIQDSQSPKTLRNVPSGLPLLFTSGASDPVGAFGKGVERAADLMRKAGVKDIFVKLYENARHEIVNEIDREKVYEDIAWWLLLKMEEKGKVDEHKDNSAKEFITTKGDNSEDSVAKESIVAEDTGVKASSVENVPAMESDDSAVSSHKEVENE